MWIVYGYSAACVAGEPCRSTQLLQQPRSRVFESCSDSPEPLDHFQVAGIGLGSPHGCHIFAKIVHYRWIRPPSGPIRTLGNPLGNELETQLNVLEM